MHNIDIRNGKLGRDSKQQKVFQSTNLILTQFQAKQKNVFRELGNKCDGLQLSIQFIEKMIPKLEAYLQRALISMDEANVRKLKDKQNSFIIQELHQKIQKIQNQRESLQKQLYSRQEELNQLKYSADKLATQNLQLATEVDRKSEQVKNLIQMTKKLQEKIILSQKQLKQISNDKKQSSPRFNKINDYQNLEHQLKQIENCMAAEIEDYKMQNLSLKRQIEYLQNKNNRTRDINEDQLLSSNNKKIYELEFKIKNMSQQNRQLEELYQTLTAKSNSIQLALHQKNAELKNIALKEKKQSKNYKNLIEKEVKRTAKQLFEEIHKLTSKSEYQNTQFHQKLMFMGATSFSQQMLELKNNIIKWVKRAILSTQHQKNIISDQLKLELEDKKNMIKNLQYQVSQLKQKLQREIQKKSTNSSLNSQSLTQNKSQAFSQDKNEDKIQEKKNRKGSKIIDELRTELLASEQRLLKTRKEYDEQQINLRRQIIEKEQKIIELSAELEFQKQNFDSQSTEWQLKIQQYLKLTQQQEDKLLQNQKKYTQSIAQEKLQSVKMEDDLRTVERQKKQTQKKHHQLNQRLKSRQENIIKLQRDTKKIIATKDKIIQQLIAKNQAINIEFKLLQQKTKILEYSKKAIQEQLVHDKQKLSQGNHENIIKNDSIQHHEKSESAIQFLEHQLKLKKQRISALQQQMINCKTELQKLESQKKSLANENEALKQSLERYKEQIQKNEDEGFSRLKRQYDRNLQNINSQLLISAKKLENQKKQHAKQIAALKSETEQAKNIIRKLANQLQDKQLELNLQSSTYKSREQYQEKIQALDQQNKQLRLLLPEKNEINHSAEQNLVKTIRPSKIKPSNKNPSGMKSTQSFQLVQTGVNTNMDLQDKEKLLKIDFGVNTNFMQLIQTDNQSLLGKNLNILDESINNRSTNTKKSNQEFKNSNLFTNLQVQSSNNEQAFEICDEEQVINFGQSAVNLQLRELFNTMRIQIEKLFNEEDISMEMIKLLPSALQDDYIEFTAYIKDKIQIIRKNNEISFIMAQPGNQPSLQQDTSLDLPEFIDRKWSQSLDKQYRRTLEEKDLLIMSLMTQKNSQENTINQLTLEKQEIEEENQNKFMNQCNIYKKEIKQHKKMLDSLEMKYESLKNVVKNILESYSSPDDLEDDFRDSMTVYARTTKLNEKDRARINYHIQRFRQIKGLQ